jgi:hypothetical protein
VIDEKLTANFSANGNFRTQVFNDNRRAGCTAGQCQQQNDYDGSHDGS